MCKCAKIFSLWGTSSPRPPTGALPLDPTAGLPSPEPPDWPVFILGLSGGIPPLKNQKSPNKKNRRDRRTRGTNSWLNDTDKNFGPDLPLLFKLHEMCIDPHQTGFVGKDSDHPQLVKFWPSHAPGKGSAAERKFLAPPYYSQRAVFASL